MIKPGSTIVPGTQPLDTDLAESWDHVGDTVYVFKLRRGVRWQPKPPVNGRELTAEDVKYTFAHSITLLLAALDVIRLPGALTESLIAASIVYVAAENFFITTGRYRWMLTFAFGLVHGLGFSSVLRERLQDLQSIAVPVVSFNLGVELGQITILLIALPVLTLLRRAPDEKARERRQ